MMQQGMMQQRMMQQGMMQQRMMQQGMMQQGMMQQRNDRAGRRSVVRLLLILLAWTMAGAMINIAVAWGCVRWRIGKEVLRYLPVDQNELPGLIAKWNQFAKPTEVKSVGDVCVMTEDEIRFRNIMLDGDTIAIAAAEKWWYGTVEISDTPFEPKSAIQLISFGGVGRDYVGYYLESSSPSVQPFAGESCAGWPCRSVISEYRGSNGLATGRRIYPRWPLWPGFAINTLFDAAVLWMLFIGPFALRQMIRRRRGGRGQCVMCAYPIGTNPLCTECGAPHAVIPKGAAVLPAAPQAGIQ